MERKPIWPLFEVDTENSIVYTFVRLKHTGTGVWYNEIVRFRFSVDIPLVRAVQQLNISAYRTKLFGVPDDRNLFSIPGDDVKNCEVDEYQCSDAGRWYLTDRHLFYDTTKPPINQIYKLECEDELVKLWEENFKDKYIMGIDPYDPNSSSESMGGSL